MHTNQHAWRYQQQRIRDYGTNSNSYAFFNLLTGPQLLEQVESLLPEHRERLFPPTETLAMFLAQALNADRSCQKAVDDAVMENRLHMISTGVRTHDSSVLGSSESTLSLSVLSYFTRLKSL